MGDREEKDREREREDEDIEKERQKNHEACNKDEMKRKQWDK
jgi:hypothetical protein